MTPGTGAPPSRTGFPFGGGSDLRALHTEELTDLAARIRSFLVERVCRTGGHLGPNLGVVELTIALHRVFDSPRDVLLFDTGHQAYVHKILTGRADGFDALRQRGGLAGYPSRVESDHDVIENSHASTALSYADGIAKALRHRGRRDRAVVAVVGDGALTGGLAWEALNNIATAPYRNLTIVLNDNGRSYDPTVGGLGEHLARLRGDGRVAPKAPAPSPARPALRATAAHAPATVFEAMGLAYRGPVDGHDIGAMEVELRAAAAAERPTVVHCVTVKGRGYGPAESDEADCLHGVGVLDPSTGRPAKAAAPTWTSVFGTEIAAIGAERPEVVCLTAAMLRQVGLDTFARRFPERVFDVGIAEQHAVCSAAGLATGGLHPVVCVYSTFLGRAVDQLLMDVALHSLPVTFVLDRAGITGPDGPSHHGMWDTALLSVVPNLRLAAPRDAARLRGLLREAIAMDEGPTAVRFPKSAVGSDIDALTRMDGLDVLHRSRRLRLDVLLVAAGVMAGPCLDAARELEAQGIGVTVVDPRWIIPINPTLAHMAARHRLAVSVEDCTRTGSMGSMFVQVCADAGITTRLRVLGLPRDFIEHGSRAELLIEHGLTGTRIANEARRALSATVEHGRPPGGQDKESEGDRP
ncbi:1-deoxy-D-xylulose-5-phosphate synthase [Nocardiopsis mwathae]|uniref:1-deoxy-D-xylulose-5-phosphate synthase n=1 Tax=Nocardiopsis mwathae TaxID=1472723 RepID=A0A7W9YMP6_9ACTN|nr:1-deoxy-D-xylulose-5-phosphate synthase [Nocardiopsis mwathae]MBB6174795.1 1-deoxy-D-xylulose-5-phosphate synthase [Nocardiopsis mwathae]